MALQISPGEIERRERELTALKAQYYQQGARCFEILMRVMTDDERNDIFERVTDRQERILLGLEAPEEARRPRPAASGGEEVCPLCGKSGLTRRGLASS